MINIKTDLMMVNDIIRSNNIPEAIKVWDKNIEPFEEDLPISLFKIYKSTLKKVYYLRGLRNKVPSLNYFNIEPKVFPSKEKDIFYDALRKGSKEIKTRRIKDILKEMMDQHRYNKIEVVINYAKKLVDAIVKSTLSKHNLNSSQIKKVLENNKKKVYESDIVNKINYLCYRGIIDKNIKNSMHNIRKTRNIIEHERQKITKIKEKFEKIKSDVIKILEWFFEEFST